MATTVLGLKTFAASDPVDYNEINDNYNKIDNGVKTALQGRAAHNLLDNSWFVNPINQRGARSYSSQGYSIDRWKSEIAGGTSFSISVSSGKLIISKSGGILRFYQILNNDMIGKTVTYAVKTSDGIFSGTCVVSNTINNVRIGSHNAYLSVYDNGNTIFSILFNDSSDDTIEIYCAALYEGSYTPDTLPAYQPKGYAAELAECQRYYQQYNTNEMSAVGNSESGITYIRCPLQTPMRVAPSLVQSSVDMWTTYNETTNKTETFTLYNSHPQCVYLKCTSSTGSNYQLVIATNNNAMAFSADL